MGTSHDLNRTQKGGWRVLGSIQSVNSEGCRLNWEAGASCDRFYCSSEAPYMHRLGWAEE